MSPQAGRLANFCKGVSLMKSRFFVVTAIVFAVAVAAGQTSVQAQNSNGNLTNNLFQQYYTPGGASQATAGMYPAPHWVPGHVGGAYYTYQPLQPHEMMYQHSRNYYNFQNGPYYQDDCRNGGGCGPGSINVTKVRWQSGVNHMGPLPFTTHPFAKLHYAFASNYYCAGGNCGGIGGLIGGRAHGGGPCQTGDCYGQ
jgi:hypothetical protein